METIITWEISVKSTPLLIKKCSHCNSTRFYCSDKFRMNAQKRNLDIWLIYRCVQCDNTCNLTILSRSKPELIDKSLFHSFSMNDRATAWQYAFSAELERKNNLKLDYASVEYEIISSHSPEEMLALSDESLHIQIKCPHEFNLKLSSIIRKYFSLSANRVKGLIEEGSISTSTGKVSLKQRVRDGDVIVLQKKTANFILSTKQ